MISKQASILPRRLIRRYHTNDPFEIAAALDITVMERSDFQRQKGAFKVVLHNSFIFINATMSNEMKRIVCAHELGHSTFDPTGFMQPTSITWSDGRTFPIETVRDFRPAGTADNGYSGDCFTVLIQGQEKHLFFEHLDPRFNGRLGRWFVERTGK